MVGDGLNSPRMQGGKTMENSLYPNKYVLRQTRRLALDMRGLYDIPMDVFLTANEEHVTSVDISKNHFSTLPLGLQELWASVSELSADRNQITLIPSYIGNFERITYMNLECNYLTDLPKEFGNLQKLRSLNISTNRFDELPTAVYDLRNLEVLLANDNRIKGIDATHMGLGALKRLNTLNLNNNNITFVPPILGNLTNIINLSINGNPFRQPRIQIISKGTKDIMEYLRNRIPC